MSTKRLRSFIVIESRKADSGNILEDCRIMTCASQDRIQNIAARNHNGQLRDRGQLLLSSVGLDRQANRCIYQ